METYPHKYSYLILDKVAKSKHWRKDILFNKLCWENWKSTCSKMKLNPYLSSCAKLNSKQIKDLGIRLEILHQIENQDRISNTLAQDNTSLTRFPHSTRNKCKNQLMEQTLKRFFSAKETIKYVIREPKEWEKIFSTNILDTALISKVYKEHKKKNLHPKYKEPINNGLRNCADISQKKIQR